jgi:hypothetical protein
MSLGTLHRVDHEARPRVLVTHVLVALVTPISLLDRDLVTAWNALDLFSHFLPPASRTLELSDGSLMRQLAQRLPDLSQDLLAFFR